MRNTPSLSRSEEEEEDSWRRLLTVHNEWQKINTALSGETSL
jgi:hypothetical protein